MRLTTAILVLLVAASGTIDAGSARAGDPRPGHETTPPEWLHAVGKLVVPGAKIEDGRLRNYREDCSATLVAPAASDHANLVISAWHCLEHYRDLSRDIVFSTRHGADTLERRARLLASGGSMDSDWAVLRLDQPIDRQQVVALAPASGNVEQHNSLLMAGYSNDPGAGNQVRTLSYDPACQLTHFQGPLAFSDCFALKGASGGAVVQFNDARTPFLIGVISAGDSAGVSVFLPIAQFHKTLQRYLAAPAGGAVVSH